MEFREKKIAYEELKGTSHLDADKALLEKVDPQNPLLQKKVYKLESMALEILWALLGRADVTREMVVSNRRDFKKNSISDEQLLIASECGTLTAKLEKAATKEEADALLEEIKSKSDTLLEEAKTIILNFANSVYPDFKAKSKKDATIALLAADLVAMTQKELNALALVLEIDAPDRKAATLRPLLEDYRANLPKEAAGTGEKMDEVPEQPDGNENELKAESSESHSDQAIDQMNADIEDIKAQLMDVDLSAEKKEELEQRLNYLESDLEDLQDQHNDLQDQVNNLADDIEAEKKSQGA